MSGRLGSQVVVVAENGTVHRVAAVEEEAPLRIRRLERRRLRCEDHGEDHSDEIAASHYLSQTQTTRHRERS
jgi:hypothetical protein